MSSSTNIAYNKTAFQPEDWDHIKCGFLTADKAVDGVADMIMRNCFCASLPNTATHTNWWSVDLALKYNVDRLVVYSRESPGGGFEDLKGVSIYLIQNLIKCKT